MDETGIVDFTCIFDRAEILQVPETGPFRMTQNIVDGMWILKENGRLRITCKLVMATLRAKQIKLIVVLRPFMYDLLLEWWKGPCGV
jgi:phosphatidylinositol kinase/protein kinase (PI-3  family)